MTPYSVLDGYQRFGGKYYFHLQEDVAENVDNMILRNVDTHLA
jgi:hypothetical protein